MDLLINPDHCSKQCEIVLNHQICGRVIQPYPAHTHIEDSDARVTYYRCACHDCAAKLTKDVKYYEGSYFK